MCDRVLSELKYVKSDIDNRAFKEPLHSLQGSTENRNNLISRRTNNGLCIWISSNSETNRQGSLIVYQIKEAQIHSWYVSIEEKEYWKVTKTKGIDKNRMESLF